MKGMIYTFYSYKGGVGRSMALANIGMQFFNQGYTTLLIDWDLEAPGLERYFESRFNLDLKDVADRPGLCDMLQQYKKNVLEPTSEDDETPLAPPVEKYIYQLSENNAAKLWLLHAGRRTEGKPWQDYVSFVQAFDWSAFYQDWEGGLYLEWLRKELKTIADVILIDSRTGVTEMGGVATQHLSDAVILLFGANYENISNTARMARNFSGEQVKKARGDRDLEIMVVPSRIDDSDSAGYSNFLSRMDEEFRDLRMTALDDGYSLKEMLIPYLSAFSYREMLIVGDKDAEKNAHRILQSYHSITSNMKNLAHDTSTIKSPNLKTQTTADPVVILSYVRADYYPASDLADYLRENRITVIDRYEHDVTPENVEEEFSRAQFLIVLISEDSNNSKFIKSTVRYAEELKKTILPIRLDNSEIPFNLQHIQSVDLNAMGAQQIIKAIKFSDQTDETTDFPSESSNPLIFISYSSFDGISIAQEISSLLKRNGFQTWLYKEQVKVGADVFLSLENALNTADAQVVVVTESISGSRGAKQEWAFMRKLKKPIVPVVLEKDVVVPFSLADHQTLYIDSKPENLIQLPELLHKLLKTEEKKQIKDVQAFLIENDYLKDNADGIVGEKTKKALRKFQSENGLTADGIIGPKTLNKIKKLEKPRAVRLSKRK